MKQDILFICGSLNQTTMMHQIAQCIDHHCYFTPFFADGIIGHLSRKGWLAFTILGGQHRHNTIKYLSQERLPVDIGGQSREYALVITCTDLLVQKYIRDKRLILVQEGMMMPEGLLFHFVRNLRLPRYLANTAATGLSDAYDYFCVASHGYKDLFIRKGVNPEKILVTGIPNFDNAAAYMKNSFPHRNYVLATTSGGREAFMRLDRIGFIQKVKRIASGRAVIFKLHPNENFDRARAEIKKFIPEALIYTIGNVHQMIANCDELVTEYSSVVYTALALGKKIHADFDLETVRPLTPIQNGGTSAQNIASICEQLLEQPVHPVPAHDLSFDGLYKPSMNPSS